ncbi:MAG: hypothetical protein ACYCT1_13020 [Steroidobacteraceae bacterium]
MTNRPSTAPAGAPSHHHTALAAVPKLDNVQAAIDAEGNVARLLHRLAQDMRENLPENAPGELQADVDALCSELGRLEQRLAALAESLDVPGGAQIVTTRLHTVDGQEVA